MDHRLSEVGFKAGDFVSVAGASFAIAVQVRRRLAASIDSDRFIVIPSFRDSFVGPGSFAFVLLLVVPACFCSVAAIFHVAPTAASSAAFIEEEPSAESAFADSDVRRAGRTEEGERFAGDDSQKLLGGLRRMGSSAGRPG